MTHPAAQRRRPFGAGSVSIGLHPDSGLAADQQIETLMDHAVRAERAGFDGITVSEHHNGFPGYLPQPLLVSSWILEATSSVWSGPAPTILSVRRARLVAEELAWTASRFPGRLGAVLARGYARSDFEHLDVPFDDRATRFPGELAALAAVMGVGRGAAPTDDAALNDWPRFGGALLVAANSVGGVTRAADLGYGVMFPGGEEPVRLGRLSRRYRQRGGSGPVVWTRSIWVGEPPASAVDELARRYRAAAAPGMRQSSGFRVGLLAGPADHVAAALQEEWRLVAADGVNLRVHLPGVPAGEIGAMIDRVGREVLPAVRENPIWADRDHP